MKYPPLNSEHVTGYIIVSAGKLHLVKVCVVFTKKIPVSFRVKHKNVLFWE